MDHEFNTLQRYGTWSFVPSTPTMNIVGCKWVYRINQNSNCTIQIYKARLVAKRFHQKPRLDFFKTFSPVFKLATIRMVLTIALQSNWALRQLDVESAFLHRDLSEKVYMTQPQGYVDPAFPNYVCRSHC